VNKIATIRNIPLFAALDDTDLAKVAARTLVKCYTKGAVVFLEGEPGPGLYWLQSGWLKGVKQSAAGREQIIQFFEAGTTFHEIAAFTDLPNPATAIALTEVEVWVIPKSVMGSMLGENPEFARHVIATLAARLQTLISLVEDLSLRPVIGRLARLLLDDAVDDTLYRPRWYTQSELAARLGSVPDVVQRTLRGMEADGLIEVERSQIRILDRQRMEDLTL
jgi:CRP-like cAMP-binding protein